MIEELTRKAFLTLTNTEKLYVIASAFQRHGIDMIATTGTAVKLVEAKYEVQGIREYTGAPEMFGGRVKSINTNIAGGLLFLRDSPSDLIDAKLHGIHPIDFLVCNLYPFEEVVRKEGVTIADAIKNMDVGGPGSLCAAAKNHEFVTVVTDPDDYEKVARVMDKHEGETTLELRKYLAGKVFRKMKAYYTAMADYFDRQPAYRPKS